MYYGQLLAHLPLTTTCKGVIDEVKPVGSATVNGTESRESEPPWAAAAFARTFAIVVRRNSGVSIVVMKVVSSDSIAKSFSTLPEQRYR